MLFPLLIIGLVLLYLLSIGMSSRKSDTYLNLTSGGACVTIAAIAALVIVYATR